MMPVRTKYNYPFCRKAMSLSVVLVEQSVEGEEFNYLCQTFQTQFVISSRRTIT
jgi:hypothetical protein